MPGPTLGRYRLAARVAQGGMGEVYRGVDVGFGGIERPVAVKLIAPAFALDAGLKRQFVDEAKLSYLLCHQNVVQVRDVGEIDGSFFIAMEWVDGADLGTILLRMQTAAGQPLPLRFSCLVAVEAARGLDYAHRLRDASGRALNLVHRDVSPSNLLVSYEGEVKVSDFGIARSRLREVTSLPGGLKGKIGYMAPEQARAESLDARADVFALGAVLYEMLTGHNPFLYDAKENEALERVRSGKFHPVRALAPSVPQGMEAIVMRAMAATRGERYQSCAQMREDLESFARRESYTLSPSDFGQFVRDLMEEAPAAAGVEAHKTVTPPKRLSGSRAVAAPKAFNDALGGALGALGGDDADGAPAAQEVAPTRTGAVPAVAMPTVPGRKITPPEEHPLPLRPPTDLTDLIPRSASRMPMIAAAAAMALAGIGAGTWWALREPAGPVPAVATTSTTAQPTVVAAPPSSVARPEPTTPTTSTEKKRNRARAATRAHLTVTSDVAADAFVDGKFVRATPMVDYELAPGRHVVKVESSARGLRLIPREESIELKPGELKELNLVLK